MRLLEEYMSKSLFDRVSFLYDFMEKCLLKDFQGSIDIMENAFLVNRNDLIADMGGGTGLISQWLHNKCDRIVVVDTSRSMLRKVKEKELRLIQADASSIPFRDNMFDTVILVNTLHHINKSLHQLVINECYRILQNQGKIFIIEVCYADTLATKTFVTIERLAVGQTFFISPDGLINFLQNAGFHQVSALFPKANNCKYIASGLK